MSSRSPQEAQGPRNEEHTWELSKENVVPNRRGVKVAALEALAEPPAVRAPPPPSLDAAREAFEAQLASSGDPLGVWVLYIKWSRDAYPTSAAAAPTLALLERCTRALKDDEACRGDIRYLKLWVAYADLCHEPEEIFRYLRANEIGVDHALLWEVVEDVLGAH
ncbi:Mad3/BUB1 homology region 1-domain-containing protein [Pavlovales sp. CCMP2436]|nr:Mad3/BUB1 homology region 1-domain-containing protein [Pavlovales sp. CCMP2436]